MSSEIQSLDETLSSIKNFATYAFSGVPAKRLLDRGFAKIMVDYANQTNHCWKNLSSKIVI